MSPVTRPALRYPGGKARDARHIISYFAPHEVYTEAYGGGGSVLLQKPRARKEEVYNDLDGELCDLFRVLRDRTTAAELREALRLTPYARREFLLSYEPTPDPVEQARRTVIRSMMGRGSDSATGQRTGFRARAASQNTHPARDWSRYPDAIDAITDRLQGVVIECRPAVDVLRAHDGPDTLHYVDPPYPAETRRGGGYRYEMTERDHRDLAPVLHALQGMVILSGYPCPLYDQELYPTWHRVERKALADGGSPRTEVLWINASAWDRLQEQGLFGGTRGGMDG